MTNYSQGTYGSGTYPTPVYKVIRSYPKTTEILAKCTQCDFTSTSLRGASRSAGYHTKKTGHKVEIIRKTYMKVDDEK